MGVQDYDDLGFNAPDYYDPRRALRRPVRHLPDLAGPDGPRPVADLRPVGLRRGDTPVPTYLSNGNHDGLVQGNEDAIKAFEELATGCFKVAASTAALPSVRTPTRTSSSRPALGFAVRPDEPGPPLRGQGRAQADLLQRHPGGRPRLRLHRPGRAGGVGLLGHLLGARPEAGHPLHLDRHRLGRRRRQESSEGNIDDPQWSGCTRSSTRPSADGSSSSSSATTRSAASSRTSPTRPPSRAAGSYDANGTYSSPDEHGHDANPGCDLDPRDSSPVHEATSCARCSASTRT